MTHSPSDVNQLDIDQSSHPIQYVVPDCLAQLCVGALAHHAEENGDARVC